MAAVKAQDWLYTVRPGDNLWDLSEKYLLSMGYWRPLQELNGITTPREIPPGSRLRIPVRWMRIQPAAVAVIFVSGDATAVDGVSGARMPVASGAELRAGDELLVGPESSVTLQFADGSEFVVQADSRLVLDTVSIYGDSGMVDTRLRLHQGRLDARTIPSIGGGTRFEIWTPAATSSVRGTEYRVAMDAADQVGRAEVVVGAIEVAGGGQRERVPEGFGTVAAVGQPVEPPRELLAPPDIAGLAPIFDRVPVQFELPPLAGAVGYRLQLAPDDTFLELLFDRRYSAPSFVGPDLPDGAYVLRVRGIDADGLEGLDRVHRFTLDARPEPPVLIQPDIDETIRVEVPTFRWAKPREVEAYHFQLAGDVDFGAPLIDAPDLTEVGFTPSAPLAPGDYYWRVATIAGGEHGPFSDPQKFTLRPSPEGPELEDPEIASDRLVFRWRAGLSGQTYQVQLSPDGDFANVVVDRTVTEPRLEVPGLQAGRYYLRVRTIDVDGFAGPFGQRQEFDVPPSSYWPLVIIPIMAMLVLLL